MIISDAGCATLTAALDSGALLALEDLYALSLVLYSLASAAAIDAVYMALGLAKSRVSVACFPHFL